MSDIENKGAGAPDVVTPPPAAQADPLKNLKAEMDRKLGNLEQTNAQLIAMLQKMNQPAPAPKANEPKLSDIWFDKPEEAARKIKEETAAEIRAEMAKQQQAVQKQQSTLQQLVSEFPELSNSEHDLTRKAVELYNSLPDDEKTSPLAYKAAVKEAAIELGIKPKRLRKSDDDDFTLGEGKGARGARAQAREANEAVEYLASQFGLELDDKRRERIKNKHGRKSYVNWE